MFHTRLIKSFFIAFVSLGLASTFVFAAPESDLWDFWNRSGNETGIDHSSWQEFLDKYLVERSEGANLVDYQGVKPADRKKLSEYVAGLSRLPVLRYSRDEQFAYWVNLYNAATVQLILDHYPVKSITKISFSFFSFGPWDEKLLEIEGKEVSLNDIEHRILRPIWKDRRIHYVVNCASISCPSLPKRALKPSTLENDLRSAEEIYLKDARAIRIEDGEMVLSSIYDWYREDFGDEESFIRHLMESGRERSYATMSALVEDAGYEYDWGLNETR